MRPCYPALLDAGTSVKTNQFGVSFYSTVYGRQIGALEPEYWAGHAVLPVLFYPGIRAPVQDGLTVFIELGTSMLEVMGAECCGDFSGGRTWHAALAYSADMDV